MVNVLFVCLGNICRSPTAEGVFRALVAREGLNQTITTDSAGTASWHTGNPPDERGQAEALKRGVDISDLRARQVKEQDFLQFDYVIAMDRSNHDDLLAICPKGHEHQIHLFLDFAPSIDQVEVPDPYYGGVDGFGEVLQMIEVASQGLLDHIHEHNLVNQA